MSDYVMEKSIELIKDDRKAHGERFWYVVSKLRERGGTHCIREALMRSLDPSVYAQCHEHKVFQMSDEDFCRMSKSLGSSKDGYKRLVKKPTVEELAAHINTYFHDTRLPMVLIWISGQAKSEKFFPLANYESSDLMTGWLT